MWPWFLKGWKSVLGSEFFSWELSSVRYQLLGRRSWSQALWESWTWIRGLQYDGIFPLKLPLQAQGETGAMLCRCLSSVMWAVVGTVFRCWLFKQLDWFLPYCWICVCLCSKHAPSPTRKTDFLPVFISPVVYTLKPTLEDFKNLQTFSDFLFRKGSK